MEPVPVPEPPKEEAKPPEIMDNLEESEVFVGCDSDNEDAEDKKTETSSPKVNGTNGEEAKGGDKVDAPVPVPKMNGTVEEKPAEEECKVRRTSGDSDHHPEPNGFVLTLTQEPMSLPLDSMLMSASCETSIISVTSSMDYEMETNTKMLSSMTDSCAEELQMSIVSSKCGSESDVSRSTEAIVEGKESKRVSLETVRDGGHRRTTPEPKGKNGRGERSSSGKTTPRLADPKPPCTCGSNSSPVTPRTPRRGTSSNAVHAAPSSLAKSKANPTTATTTATNTTTTTPKTPKLAVPNKSSNTPKQERSGQSSTSKTPERIRSGTVTPGGPNSSKPNQTGARAKSVSRSSSTVRARDIALSKPKPDRCKERKASGKSDQSDVTPPDNKMTTLRRRRVRDGKDTGGDSSSQDSRGSDRFQLSRSVSVRDRVSPDSAPDSRPNALDKYGTLPRRKKTCESRSSREPSITRASLLRFWKTKEDLDNKERQFWFGFAKDSRLVKTATSLLSRGGLGGRSMPPMPARGKERTLICAEAGVQTVLTSDDVQQAIGRCGDSNEAPLGEQVVLGWRPVRSEQEVQTEGGELVHLESQLRVLQDEHRRLQEDHRTLTEVHRTLTEDHRRLQEGHRKAQEEEFTSRSDNIHDLQNQLQVSNQMIASLQEEANYYRNTCRTLQQDLDKSTSTQKTMFQQLQESENEAHELQDFMQAEKNMMAEALKDAENEVNSLKEKLAQKESDLKQQQAQCHHLVRISEQRRHEYLTLQSRMAGVQGRARDLLLQQGAEASNVAVSLADLSARLDTLVQQLLTAYAISQKEIDTPAAHKAVVAPEPEPTKAQLSPDMDLLKIPSPKKGASLVTAVLHALNNAASSPFSNINASKSSLDSHSPDPKTTNGSSPDPKTVDGSSPDPKPINGSSPDPKPIDGSSPDPKPINGSSPDPKPINGSSPDPKPINGSSPDPKSVSPDPKPINGSSPDPNPVNVDPKPSDGLSPTTSNGHGSAEHTDSSISPSVPPLRLIGSESLQNLSDAIQRRRGLDDCLPEHGSPDGPDAELSIPVGEETPPFADAPGFTLQDQVFELDRSVTKLLRILQIIQLENDSIIDEIHAEKLQLMQQVQELRMQMKSPAESSDSSVHNGHAEKESDGDTVSLQKEMAQLHEKLGIKDRQLEDLRKNLSKGRRVYNNGWTWTASEVQRLNDVISNVLETLQGIPSVVANCPALAKLQHELQNINTSLPPVERPCNSNSNLNGGDLNANPPADFGHTNGFQPAQSPSDMPQQTTP